APSWPTRRSNSSTRTSLATPTGSSSICRSGRRPMRTTARSAAATTWCTASAGVSEVLEAPKEVPTFSRVEALRMLVHLVGDIHQPLRVATGYYNLDGGQPSLITDPPQALHKPDDRGGNQLCYHPAAHSNRCQGEFHAFWDVTLVLKAGHTSNAHKLAGVLGAKAKDRQWVNA